VNVVITGLGPVTCIGLGSGAFHAAQLRGESGIRLITRFDAGELSSQIAGEVDVQPAEWLDRLEYRATDRFAQLALIAAQLAVTDAGLDLDRIDPERAGVIVGSGAGGLETFEQQGIVRQERGLARLSPLGIPMFIGNMAAARISMRFGFQGPSTGPSTACATGADALCAAYQAIALGEADLVLAGGTEAPLTSLTVGGFCALRALSKRNDSPQTASRPFSRDRDGFVIAEGAGVLVLESEAHARRRGAPILARLVGYGRTSDAHHPVEPHPEGEGARRAMTRALAMAGLPAGQVGYINAHGTSTLLNDRAETLAIQRVFGEAARRIPVSSTKSMIGHAMGASGALEAIATVQALGAGVVPPTINLHEVDPELNLDYVPHEAREHTFTHALSNSFAFGGQNVTLLLARD